MKPIKIIIADDHWMVRDGIKQLLELDNEFNIIAEVGTGSECLGAIKDTEAEVLLLDINLPELNGLEVLSQIRKNEYDIKVVFLTIHNEPEYVNKAMELGANGYVLKDSSSDELKKAIRLVIENNEFIDPVLIPQLYSDCANVYKRTNDANLTEREFDVLKLLSQGLFNKEIGYQLGISEKTVKNHVSNIFRKINVSDRTQAAIYAIKNNIIELI